MPKIIDAEIVLPYLEIGYREQQADWAETDPNKVSYIKNKPVIPAAQINSDWAENDTTKKSHVLNRTHYREFSISSYSENINLHASSGKSTGSVYGYNQYPAGFMQKFKEGNSFSFILGNDTFNGDIQKRGYLSAFYVGNIHLHIPDLPDTGEDWCVYSDLLGQDSLHFIVDDSYTGSYSLEMNILEATYHQLNENYIPDTIARVSQIELLDGTATIASETNSIVTIKGGVKQEDGLISNSSSNDITLAKVAKTGVYSDLVNTPDIASIADGEITIHNANSDAHNGVDGRVSTIEGVIPSQTYDTGNELADKTFVNSSIATNTATFKGTFNLVNDLNLSTSSTQAQIGTALGNAISQEDNNDYSFVLIPTSDSTPTEIDHVDRYKYNGTDWVYEYTLNNSGFTAAQWAAINSGATTTNISQIATNTGNISTNATNIAQLDLDMNQNYPYIGVNTNWGTTATNCYLRSTYFKDGIVPQKKGDLVFSQGTRNFHRCGDLVWDAGQGCYKTTPTFLFHLGADDSAVVHNTGTETVSGLKTFSDGLITGSLFFGSQITAISISGSATWNLSDLKTMMKIVLNNASNTITLPQGGNNPFRFQIIVMQDSTGGRDLSFTVANSGTIYNPSEFDFTSGEGDQLCICTMIWTGNEYIYECTNYVGGN